MSSARKSGIQAPSSPAKRSSIQPPSSSFSKMNPPTTPKPHPPPSDTSSTCSIHQPQSSSVSNRSSSVKKRGSGSRLPSLNGNNNHGTSALASPSPRKTSSMPSSSTLTESATIKVVVRLRPMNAAEKKHGTLPVIKASTQDKTVTVIKGQGSRQVRSSFSFDNVFTAFSTQEEVFEETLKPLIGCV